jgi:hypothetical protein
MHSIELYIPECKEFLVYQRQYSSLFRKVYSNAELMEDKIFKKECVERYDLLDAATYDNIKIQVRMKYSQMEAFKKKKIELFEQYNNEIKNLSSKKQTKKRIRDLFYLRKKAENLKANIEKDGDIVFGGKATLRKVVYNKNMFNKTKDDLYDHQYIKYLNKYRLNRILPYYFVGNSCERGNRKFDFDFVNRTVTFKPDRKNHFIIKVRPGKKQEKILLRLQAMADRREIALTVSLTTKKIVITYDNELLNGYAFNDKECKAEQAVLGKDQKEQRKGIWLKHKIEQEERKLEGKIKDRFSAIDMNPEYIGLTIRNKKEILFTKCYDLTKLVKDMKHNDTTEIKYNIAHIFKDIFKHADHYKVVYFTTEDLSFEHNQQNSKKMNRKTMVAWCRTFQKNLISKYCENTGITHLQPNAAYSSFVGNLLYPYFDPIAASAEMARRGMIFKKILTEDWYPAINKLRLDNLNLKTYVPDLESGNLTVSSLFDTFRSRNLRYRRLTKPQHKSKLIKCDTFW